MRLFPKDRDLSLPPDKVELEVRASDFQLAPEDVHFRLDTFLSHHLKWRSRSSLQKLIHDGYVSVDPSTPSQPKGSGEAKLEKRPGRKLFHGSRVVVTIPEDLRLRPPHPSPEHVDVAYEDDYLIAVDKPHGVTVHPAGRHLTDTLIQRLHGLFRERHGDNRHFVKLCHRLDRETSGLLLCGKDALSHSNIMGQFERRKVEKEYLAIVWGSPEAEFGKIDFPISSARASRIRLKMACVSDGMESRTDWKVVTRYSDCTLVSCKPFTGRQHQIRVHMEAIGYPLVGDKLYGLSDEAFLLSANGELPKERLDALGMPRQALHNHRLVVTHPNDGSRLEMTCPLATDMVEFLRDRRPIEHK
ncbi:MAG: 23S rRNA pseudouridine1911/1915/1917 synthase [Planctomycetota bacterium]|jgi:23S rRNA pseudouridine1911/1915/1917 synthase